MRKINIAIDGYSACGKSSTAKALSFWLQYVYIDSGSMYRAVTLFFLKNYINFNNPKEIKEALDKIQLDFYYHDGKRKHEIYLNGLNVEDEIRKMYVTDKVGEVSAIVDVRRALVRQQQKLGKKRGVVMDGRDIGTVVFPDAELKIFMTADIEVRAHRRQKELLEMGEMVEFEAVLENLRKRDKIDETRVEGPLIQAPDAHFMDTTHMTLEEQMEEMLNLYTTEIVEKALVKN